MSILAHSGAHDELTFQSSIYHSAKVNEMKRNRTNSWHLMLEKSFTYQQRPRFRIWDHILFETTKKYASTTIRPKPPEPPKLCETKLPPLLLRGIEQLTEALPEIYRIPLMLSERDHNDLRPFASTHTSNPFTESQR